MARADKKVSVNSPPKKILREIKKLQSAGQVGSTLVLCNRLHTLGYKDADFLLLYGTALKSQRDYNKALFMLNAAFDQEPSNPDIIHMMASVFFQMKDVETAIELFKRVTEMDERHFNAWKDLGIALQSVERFHAAQIALSCAHFIKPENVEAIVALIGVYLETLSYKQAEELIERLFARGETITPNLYVKRLQIASRLEDFEYIQTSVEGTDYSSFENDDQARVENLYAYFLQTYDRWDEALEVLNKWVGDNSEKKIDSALLARLLKTHAAAIYADKGDPQKAIEMNKALVAENPSDVSIKYNLANLQIAIGDLEEAYENYEVRFKWREYTSKRRRFSIPRWKGEPIKGKKLLVWREQGIGDELRYGSMVQDLKDMGCDVTYEVTEKLIPLWKHSYPWADIQPEGDIECRGDENYAHFDYQIPVISLAPLVRSTVEAYDELQKPWLGRFPEIEEKIRKDLKAKPDELVVGICWRSFNMSPTRARFLFADKQLAPLKDLPNVKWVNVQYDAGLDEVNSARESGLDIYHYTDIDQKDDLVTASGLLGACDLVVTVGGSVGDLCGGLGVPMVYIPKPRAAAFLGTDKLPWFPNSKGYPIASNQGDAVIQSIIDDWDDIISWAKDLNSVDRYFCDDIASDKASLEFDRQYEILNK